MTFKSSYIDKTGKTVIDASRYDSATHFSEGWAAVEIRHQGWGFIDKTGALVIPPKFEVASSFREGLAAVLLDDRWGFINKDGVLVIENQFDWTEGFSEGVAVVQRSSKPKRPPLPQLTGSDTPLVSHIVEVWDLTDDSGGQRADDDSEFLVIDTTGKLLANLDQMKLEVDIDDARFSKGLLCVNRLETDAMGYVNKSWEFVIQPKFERAAPFSEGLARVAVIENEMEKLGFIDEQGHFAISPTFNTDFDFRRNSSDFSEGLAAVSEGLNPSRTQEETFVYIDKAGEIVLVTEFFYAGQFREGLATVYDAEMNRWGFIDKRGQVAIPLQYEDVHDFSEGLALVGG
jgi:KWG Leptospira.